MIYDYSKLRGKIIEKYGTCAAFSKAMDLTKASMSSKLLGRTAFRQDEIDKACTLLSLSNDDLKNCFFCHKSREISTNNAN